MRFPVVNLLSSPGKNRIVPRTTSYEAAAAKDATSCRKENL